jgi:hypothetical protein
MGLMDKLSKAFVYRRCPAGRIHKVNKDMTECGHTGRILDWCEEYQRWIPNPTKTEVAKSMIANDEEFAVDREAREKLEEALRNGDIKPALDYKRLLMSR